MEHFWTGSELWYSSYIYRYQSYPNEQHHASNIVIFDHQTSKRTRKCWGYSFPLSSFGKYTLIDASVLVLLILGTWIFNYPNTNSFASILIKFRGEYFCSGFIGHLWTGLCIGWPTQYYKSISVQNNQQPTLAFTKVEMI